MKGGLLINNELNDIKTIVDASARAAAAVEYFKINSTFEILTNTSANSITFKATLNAGVKSPFIQIRSDIYGQPVQYLLFKYSPLMPPGSLIYGFDVIDRRHGTINLSTPKEIADEFLRQLKIYKESYNTISSAYEPICPYPIHYQTKLDKKKTIQEIVRLLKNNEDIHENILEVIDTLGYESSKHSRQEIIRRQAISDLGLVVMEFMEGYFTLSSIMYRLKKKQLYKVNSLIAYELSRLHYIGVNHGDLHSSNIMYNPNYLYITDGKQKEDLGRVIILDFGLSTLNKKFINYIENSKKHIISKGGVIDIKTNDRGPVTYYFRKPYTFDYIYQKRLELTFIFRQNIINKTVSIINNFILKNHADKLEFNKIINSYDFKIAKTLLNMKILKSDSVINNEELDVNVSNEEFNDPYFQEKDDIYNKFNMTKRLQLTKNKKILSFENLKENDLSLLSKMPLFISVKTPSNDSIKKSVNKSVNKSIQKYNLKTMSAIALNTVKKITKFVFDLGPKNIKSGNSKTMMVGGIGVNDNNAFLDYLKTAFHFDNNISNKLKKKSQKKTQKRKL